MRAAGWEALVAHLAGAGGLPRARIERLATAALGAAAAHQVAVPGERPAAPLIRELAQEALVCRARLARLDHDLQAALGRHPEATLGRHPEAALIRSLPGRGAVLTAARIAEAGALSRFRSADALATAACCRRADQRGSGCAGCHRGAAGTPAARAKGICLRHCPRALFLSEMDQLGEQPTGRLPGGCTPCASRPQVCAPPPRSQVVRRGHQPCRSCSCRAGTSVAVSSWVRAAASFVSACRGMS